MTTEWDNTAWNGTPVSSAVAVKPRRRRAPVAKAETGPFVANIISNPPLSALARSPQKKMREAQSLFHRHPWIGAAERAVTRKVVGLPWHLEDENDDEVGDESAPELLAVQALLEKPQAKLSVGLPMTRTALMKITTRHLGLCGHAYWYLDQLDAAARTPLGILYVNPARVWPVADKYGNLIGWKLDCADDAGNGGMPLELDELLPFYLEPPDWGHYTTGLVEAAWQKAQLTTLADAHAGYVLSSGGRIAGIVSPKDGAITDPEQFAQLVKDFRDINERPDAAKRTTILRGPIDFNQTAADPSELGLGELAKMTRDDIFGIWNVPPSEAGIPTAGGLNSGEKDKHGEVVLMQGPVHDRVQVIRETIQFGLLDRWQKVGKTLELVIEEPTFDDETPVYALLTAARDAPLTRNQRLAIIGKDPLPEYGPDGEPLGLAIDLPAQLIVVGQGEEPEGGVTKGRFENAPTPKPEPVVQVLPPGAPGVPGIPPPAPKLLPPPTKAGPLGRLRETVEKRVTPRLHKDLLAFLHDQRAEIAARIRKVDPGRVKGDTASWWQADRWNRALAKVVAPHVAGIAGTVTAATERAMATKADPFTERVEQELGRRTGLRIKGINDTTRDAVADAIRQGFDDGLSPAQIADLIETLPAFDEARAETVARTETGFAYNAAAVESYREFGIDAVEVIDGDGDDICAHADGAIWSLDEANADPLGHPNCTRDFAPYFGAPKARIDPYLEMMRELLPRLAQPPAPNISVHTSNLTRTTVERDDTGRWVVMEEPVGSSLSDAEKAYINPLDELSKRNAELVDLALAATTRPVELHLAEGAIQASFTTPEAKPTRKVVHRDTEGRITEVSEE